MKGTIYYTTPIRSRNISYINHKGLLGRIDHHETLQVRMEAKGSGDNTSEM